MDSLDDLTNWMHDQRNKLGLTQTELAEAANVTQRFISSLESGEKINPGYENLRKVVTTLEQLIEKIDKTSSLKAEDILEKKIIGFASGVNAQTAYLHLLNKDISQAPIYKDDEVIGSIFFKDLCYDNLSLPNKTVDHFKKPKFPTVNKDTPYQVINKLLDYSKAILVEDENKIIGIISEEDLFKVKNKME